MEFDCYVPVIMDFVISYKDFESVLRKKETEGYICNLTISNINSNLHNTYLEARFTDDYGVEVSWLTENNTSTNMIYVKNINLLGRGTFLINSDNKNCISFSIIQIIADMTRIVETECIFAHITKNNEKVKYNNLRINEGNIEEKYEISLSDIVSNSYYSTNIKKFLDDNPDIKHELAEKTKNDNSLENQLNALGLKLIELRMTKPDFMDCKTFSDLLSQCCLSGATNKQVLNIYKLFQ